MSDLTEECVFMGTLFEVDDAKKFNSFIDDLYQSLSDVEINFDDDFDDFDNGFDQDL